MGWIVLGFLVLALIAAHVERIRRRRDMTALGRERDAKDERAEGQLW